MTEILLRQLLDNSILELAAVIFAIAYLVLAIREHIGCWAMALISTTLYLVIFIDVKLYMEAGLQLYYIAMAIYGWQQWQRGGDGTGVVITTWHPINHLVALALIAMLTFASSHLLSTYTDARLPVIDSFTTWSAIVTTYMVARKVLENWIYWFVIDAISIYLYLDRGLYFTSALFLLYLILVVAGFMTWMEHYRHRPSTPPGSLDTAP